MSAPTGAGLPKIVSVPLSPRGVRAIRRMHDGCVFDAETRTIRNGSEPGALWFEVNGDRFVWNRADKLVRAWVRR